MVGLPYVYGWKWCRRGLGGRAVAACHAFNFEMVSHNLQDTQAKDQVREAKVLDHLCSKLRTKSISKLVFPLAFLSLIPCCCVVFYDKFTWFDYIWFRLLLFLYLDASLGALEKSFSFFLFGKWRRNIYAGQQLELVGRLKWSRV